MIKKLFKKIVPKNSLVFKTVFKIYDYKYWYPKPWKFDVLESYAAFKREVYFIQVGSNNGLTGDPIYPFIQQYGWMGVLVEPVPYLFEELKKNYQSYAGSLIFENSAIAHQDGQLPFYRLQKSDKADLPVWYDQLGSFNKEVVWRHRSAIPHFDELVMEDTVSAIRFETLVSKHGISKADLLHIDTEGYDYEVLKGTSFEKLGIELVMFEHVHLSDVDYRGALQLLRKHGFVYGIKHSDTIGVKKDLFQLLKPGDRN
jgi:FkbM family methyltransferase